MTRSRTTRFVALALAAALCAVSLVACASPNPGESVTVNVGSGGAIATTSEVEVVIPAGAVKGSGTVTVKPTSRGTMQGVSIKLSDGARLVGKATLHFKYQYKKGEPAPIIVSAENTSDALTIAASRKSGSDVVVSTIHFSNWFVVGWNAILDNLRGALDGLFKDIAAEAQPTCPANADAAKNVAITGEPTTKLVVWCLDEVSGSPILRAANGRSYVASVEYTPALTLNNPPDIWENLVPSLFPWLAFAPSVKGDKTLLMDPKQEYNFDLASGASAIKVNPSGAAYLVTALGFAIQTVLTLSPFLPANTPKQAKEIIQQLGHVQCLSDFHEMATSSPTTAKQVAEYMTRAIPAVVGCVSDMIKSLFPSDYFLTVLIAGLSWLQSGLQTLAAGLAGLSDSILNLKGWELDLKYTRPLNPADAATWVIDSGGIGPIRLGMTLQQAAALDIPGLHMGPDNNCPFVEADLNGGTVWAGSRLDSNLQPSGSVDWVQVMNLKGPHTNESVAVGTSISSARSRYPAAKYVPYEDQGDNPPTYLDLPASGNHIFFVTQEDQNPSDPLTLIAVSKFDGWALQSTCPG